MDYKYTGIILSKRNVGETDRIYTIYTLEEGKIRALAKGVRKSDAKLAGLLEPVTLAEIFVAKTRGLGKITGAIIINNFSGIKSEWDVLAKVFRVFGIFIKKIDELEKDPAIFNLLADLLFSLEKNFRQKGKADVLYLGFIFKFLDYLGYRLEAGKCINCRSKLDPDDNFFSPKRGGILCSNCHARESSKIRISSGSIKLIRIILKNRIASLSKVRVSSAEISSLQRIAEESLNWSL